MGDPAFGQNNRKNYQEECISALRSNVRSCGVTPNTVDNSNKKDSEKFKKISYFSNKAFSQHNPSDIFDINGGAGEDHWPFLSSKHLQPYSSIIVLCDHYLCICISLAVTYSQHPAVEVRICHISHWVFF